MGDGSPGHGPDGIRSITGPIAEEYGIVRVYLFGSRARGDAVPRSDYDLCIFPPEGMGGFRLNGFYRRLCEALGGGVDLVTERCLGDDGFGREVLRDRLLVYGSDGYSI